MRTPRKVYLIRHNVTNRVYIGSSANVDKRLSSHIYNLRNHKHIVEDMQDDFDKYGEDYTFTILEEITEYKDKYKEYEWMQKYQSHIRGTGYNYKDHAFIRKYQHFITFNGKTLPITAWADETGIPYDVLYGRIFQRKWSVEKALTTPYKKYLTLTEMIRRAKENQV